MSEKKSISKEEANKVMAEFFESYMGSITKQLLHKRMTVDKTLDALKYDLFTQFPDESELSKGKLYIKVLGWLKDFYFKIEREKNSKTMVLNGKTITMGEVYKMLGNDNIPMEMYHKINAELMSLTRDEKWIGIFHSKEHFEAFEYILDSFYIEEHTKTLFSSLWIELGGDKAQKILMRCTCKKYTDWVFKHYLPNEEKKPISFVSVKVKDEHHYRKQIRIKKKTYKNQDIFKSTVLRRLQK